MKRSSTTAPVRPFPTRSFSKQLFVTSTQRNDSFARRTPRYAVEKIAILGNCDRAKSCRAYGCVWYHCVLNPEQRRKWALRVASSFFRRPMSILSVRGASKTSGSGAVRQRRWCAKPLPIHHMEVVGGDPPVDLGVTEPRDVTTALVGVVSGASEHPLELLSPPDRVEMSLSVVNSGHRPSEPQPDSLQRRRRRDRKPHIPSQKLTSEASYNLRHSLNCTLAPIAAMHLELCLNCP